MRIDTGSWTKSGTRFFGSEIHQYTGEVLDYDIDVKIYNVIKATEKATGQVYKLGKYDGSDYENNKIEYTRGDKCDNGEKRRTTITFICASKTEIVKVEDSPQCVYEILMHKECSSRGMLSNFYRPNF